MAALTYEYSGAHHGGMINGRVLIGRKMTQGVVIADPAVSRLHAWIDERQGTFVLTDAGSRTGTFVNGEAIVRWELQPGDEIRIGPAAISFVEALPEDVQELNLSSRAATVQISKTGILFDCKCGSPLWVEIRFAGKRGLCKYCGEPVTVPSLPAPNIAAAAPKRVRPALPTKSMPKCGVCHSAVERNEEITVCPECGTNYHTDCWLENYGCSTYGCTQVNAIKPAAVIEEEVRTAALAATTEPPASTPWEWILIAASLLGLLISAVLFGVPAVVVGVGGLVALQKGKIRQHGLFSAAMVVCILGVIVGLAVSDFFWMQGRHLP
jgi:pSer/pThr/pTyr-binding forkhead associated (FHA) protein